ncbi:S41 family peptidase [Marinobacter sediminum]|uniref:S41 family peptidase n=1 Tax=Marinobacter sediminum TaxID=256323 RepID=UPI00202FABDE|nr:S41 family peptidase [Marinobacter sediminum]MCM0613299.1 S41 family peptidase [Marinobacter sediminum]
MKPGQRQNHSLSAPAFENLQGVWRSQGYGKILLIEHDRYTLFEETAISCRKLYTGSLEELNHYYEDLVVSPGGQAFSAHRVSGVARISFRRLKALPANAAEARRHDPKDPEYNFEIFWRTFHEQYALFELKGVAWDQAYETYRPQINANSSRETLFATMAAMLRPLKDGHIRLHTPSSHYSAGAQPALYQRLTRELEDANDDRELTSYLGDLKEWLHDVIHEDYLGNGVSHGGNRLVEWGRLNDTTGYLHIRAMAGQSGKTGKPAADLSAIDGLMQRVLADIGELPNLVVDLRSNGGGYDGVALRFAAYLMDRKRLAFTKSARHGDGFTGKQPIHVAPASETYRGNLFVLTSELTASAAEIFVLSLLQHPRLTLIGEPTQGILSDTLERHLPNGWHLTLSNEIYRAYDGEVYEDVGIPPHIRLHYLGRKGREEGKDPMLERVLKLVGG